MTASYDLATDIGQIRLLIGDTDVVPATDAHFTDEELQVFLTLGGGVYMAAAMALKAWAKQLSGNMTSEHIGDYSYTKKEVDNMLAIAANYENLSATIPAADWSEMDLVDYGEGED
ncbi:MAG: hypothetical protein PHQ43_10235 [Dehalococcoidales bacterium]|nr:hypothetical protein [Dehalococcoidales bacterium]